MMGRFLVLLTVLVALACKEISFREPQPKGRRSLNSIPRKLQGQYLPYQENGELSMDTVIVGRFGYRFGYYDPVPSSVRREYEDGLLGDSLVLKFYRGYYFLNLHEKSKWILRVIRQEKNGDLTYMAMEQSDVDFNEYAKRLSREIRIDSIVVGDETLYHIDPDASKLVELIEKGFFTKTSLKRIADARRVP